MNLYELNEQPKHASFCFGRMNPPTLGHRQLISKVVEAGYNSNYFIFVSQSQDAEKNPLDYDTKIDFLRELYPNVADHVVHNPALRTIMQIAQWLYNEGYRSVTFVAGSDRLEEFKKLLDGYNGVEGKNVFYDFDSINYVSSGDRDPDAEGTAGISATDAREAAKAGNLQAFTQATGAGKHAQELFNAVRKGMLLEAFDGINAQMNTIKTGLNDVNKQVDTYVKLMASAEKLAVEHAAKHPEHAADIQKLYQAFVNKLQRADDQIDVAVGYNAYAQKIKNESINEEQLNELANNPYKFRLRRQDDDFIEYVFTTESDVPYSVQITSMGYPGSGRTLSIEFVQHQKNNRQKTSITGAGDAYRVFSTVNAVLKQFFLSSAFKEETFNRILMLADNNEPSRIKLYNRILPTLSIPGYKFDKVETTKDFTEYSWSPNKPNI